MNNNIIKLANEWMLAKENRIDLNSEYYCQTRDVFIARHSSMTNNFLRMKINENIAYVISAIAGEIGNNSFDHNVANWPNVMGIFFAYKINNGITIILADRGRGVQATLKRVKPEIKNDVDALTVAFTERISGRAPEKRGNGLKYVRNNISKAKMHLEFFSGNAKTIANNNFIVEPSTENYNGCLAIIKIKL